MTSPTLIVSHAPVKLGFDRKSCQHLQGEFLTMYKYPKIKSTNPSQISIWTYLHSLNASESWLLTQILNDHSYKNNIAEVIALNQTEKDYIKNGYKKLYEDGWITRVKRSNYMLNPVIKEAPQELMVDVITSWNKYCHVDAIIHLEVHKNTTAYNYDTAKLLTFIDQLHLTSKSDTELKSVITTMRELNWLNSNNTLTPRTPIDMLTPLNELIIECDKRGLI